MELKEVYDKIVDMVWTHYDYYNPPREGVVRKGIEVGCDTFLLRISQGDDFIHALDVADKVIAIYAKDVVV